MEKMHFMQIYSKIIIVFDITIRILAVADGVGGWISYGIDSGKFSRELC